RKVMSSTDKASDQIREMMKEETTDARLRSGVKGGGCSRLSYSLGFDYEINEVLAIVEKITDILGVMFRQEGPIRDRTTMDVKQNMMGGGLSSDNPNAIVSCGCGPSCRAEGREGTAEKC